MDFASLVLALILYYIRPQEWISAIKPLRPVLLVGALAVASMFMQPGGISRKRLFRTPADWLVLAYCLWIVFSATDRKAAFEFTYPFYLFYIVTVQALSSIQRINRFLVVWAVMVFLLATIGILTFYGIFDPTYAKDLTDYKFRGRLMLGTSIFCNPNALGHGLVPAILMLYFLFIWNRPIFSRVAGIPLIFVPMFAIYLTLSKGAFISGFVTAALSFSFGRPKIVQILVLFFAITGGWTAIKMLPRMNEIEHTKTDEAIQGRVAAFKFGLQTFKSNWKGIGVLNFRDRMEHATHISKAPHSAYNEIGCELGWPGMFLFVAILYSSLKVLFTSQTRNAEEERIKRILFTMMISYMISSWMVDFAFRTTFFMMIATIGAFHRLLLVGKEGAEHETETVQDALRSMPALSISGLGPTPVAAAPTGFNQTAVTQMTISVPARPSPGSDTEAESEALPSTAGIKWQKLRWFDWLLVLAMVYGVVKVWEYGMNYM